MTSTKFLTLFLIAMIPTYLYRWIFFVGNVTAFTDPAMRGRTQEFINSMDVFFYLLMLVSYIAMTFVSYKRGLENGKGFLFAFPIAAAVFDLILIFVPFIPTIFNILTIVFGLITGNAKVEPEATRAKDDFNKIKSEILNLPSSNVNISRINTKTQNQSINNSLPEFNGAMDLQNDAYKIFLSKKYNIQKNNLFNKFEVDNTKLFDTLDEALLFAFNEEQRVLNNPNALSELDNLDLAEVEIKNKLTKDQWEEALVSSRKIGKTIPQWRDVADQLMDELEITYKNWKYCVGEFNCEYLNDAVNYAKSSKESRVILIKNGKCPNCDFLINLLDLECAKCKASFGEMSTYRPKPL